ncbi:hypothetical protein Peur_018874 [Populus x canadensis]
MEGDVWVTPNFTSSHAIPRLGGAASNGHGGLIALSLHATRRLPPSSFKQTRPRGLSHPTITIFSAPTAPGSNQSLAIRSWLALPPQITVVLFTQHPSFASAFGSRVLVDSTTDFTFLGTPFFHSMLEKSRLYTTGITVFVDPRTVRVSDLISTLNYAYELDRNWLLVASLRNVAYFPFHLDDAGEHWLREDGQRLAFDASWTISCFSLNYPEHWSEQSGRGSSALEIENRSWEDSGNSHPGAIYASMFFHEINYTGLVKLLNCEGKYIFVDITEDIVYPSVCQTGSQWTRRVLRSFYHQEKYGFC